MARLKGHAPWIAVVAITVVALMVWNIWWVAENRHGYLFTIDEAGYMSIGLTDHLGFQNGGLQGWWEAIEHEVPQAPLLPALTSVTLIFKDTILNAFGVLIAFMALLAFASYGIAARLAGPRLGALAAIIAATLPGTIIFTREYVFAMGVAALLSCSVYALLRSDGLRSRRWSLACGIAIGLMLLARTMTVAFVPGLILTAVIAAFVRGHLRGEGEMGRRAVGLGLLIVSGFAVAATWYWRNITPVYDYLTSYGYGSQSAYYGADHPLLSWDRWRDVAVRMVQVDLLLPMAVALLLGLIVLAVVAVGRVRSAPDRKAELTRLAASDTFSVAFVLLYCYLVLTSSRNGGEGFTIPVAALLPPLAVVSLRYLSRPVVTASVTFLAAVTLLNVLSNSNVSNSLAKMRTVSVPAFGSLPWINGVPHAVSAMRTQLPGPESYFSTADHEWEVAGNELAGFVLEATSKGAHEPIGFASRNYALNTSTLALDGLADFDHPFYLFQLNPEPDTVASYARQLREANIGVLITMSSEEGDYPPLVTQAYAETAARQAGYSVAEKKTLPDGRLMRVWIAPPE